MRGLFDNERPVTSLKFHNDEGRIVVRDGDMFLEVDSGQMLLRFGGPRAAGKIEDRFGPARVRERFDEARHLAETDPLRALTLYRDLLGREPHNFEAHLEMAALLEREGHSAAALRHLLGAAAILPTRVEVHLKLGLLYRQRAEDHNALQSFMRAAACDPLSLEAHRNLAELYDKMGRPRDALRHLSTIHRLSRDH
ncbi:MAG: tetratricopeptide repeat protein [Pseudomonadota bacterium]